MKKLFNKVTDRFTRDLDQVGKEGLTRLQLAVDADDRERLRLLQRLGADLNATGLTGETPLLRAVVLGNYRSALLLIELGADVNLADSMGQTPLHKACLQGNTALLRALIAAGADVHACDREGRTGMHMAPQHGEDVFRQLAAAGADVNAPDTLGRRPLHYYLRSDRMLRELLYRDADPNLGGAFPSAFSAALSVPLVASHPGIIAALLSYRADVNAPAQNGERLLHVAARLGQRDLFQLALQTADLSLCDDEGNTVLHALMRLPQPDLVRAVLAHAPGLATQPNLQGVTPLQILAADMAATPTRGDEAHVATLTVCAQVLIAHGADASSASPGGASLLHEAVRRNLAPFVDFLATRKADLNARDKTGHAPLHLAVNAKNLDLVDQLLDHGADADLTDGRGWTLLDRLAEKKDRESPIVQRLIVAGGQYAKQLALYPDQVRKPAAPRATTPANDPGQNGLDGLIPAKKVTRRSPPPSF